MPIARGTSAPIRPLAITENRPSPVRASEADDPAFLIPQPPQLASLTQEKTLPLLMIPASPEGTTQIAPLPMDPLSEMKQIHRRAVTCYSKMDSFEARLTRREVVNNKEQPKEVIHFQFRKKPMSLHMKWIGTEGQGREVVFVSGKYDNKMQILPARGDTFPLPPIKMALAPDDPMVRNKSRHDIRQAALGEAIQQVGTLLTLIEKNPGETYRLKSLGKVNRPEYSTPMDGIEETIPPGADPQLSKGGKRLYFWDPTPQTPSKGLPVLGHHPR